MSTTAPRSEQVQPTTPAKLHATKSPAERRKAFTGATAGHLIEWYDYGVYGFLAVYVGQHFFSSSSPAVALLSSFATFALSFFIRPMGGLVFGPLADRIGRKRTMALIMFLMSGATFMIGVLPTYDTIGILAPALLIFARLLQGLSAGGEIGTVTSYIGEFAGPHRRGFSTSLLMTIAVLGLTLGSIVANGLAALIGDDAMSDWGWRIPFLIAGPLGLVAEYIRSRLEDSAEFAEISSSGHSEKQPIRACFKWKRAMLLVAGHICLLGSVFYMLMTYMSTYLTATLEFSNSTRFWMILIVALAAGICMPIGGWFTDTYGRKPMLAVTSGLMIPALIWLFMSAEGSSPGGFFIPLFVVAVLFGFYSSTPYAVMTDLLPTRIRATGISLAYNIPIAIFGGAAPFIASALLTATDDIASPMYFFVATAAISFVAVLVTTPRDYQRAELSNRDLLDKIAESRKKREQHEDGTESAPVTTASASATVN